MNDDLQSVRTLLAPADPCPPGTTTGASRDAEGRAAFARITSSRPAPRHVRAPRRARVRLVTAAALTVAVAGGAVAVAANQDSERATVPRLSATPVANAQQLLSLAADQVKTRVFIGPTDGQWTYVETSYRTLDKPDRGDVFTPGTPLKSRVDQMWVRADGTKMATMENGKLEISPTGGAMPPSDYASLAALPRDPNALLAWARKNARNPDSTDEQRNADAFSLLGSLLNNSVLPPEQEAATYRALAKIPGIALSRTSLEGRPVLAVSRLVEGWLKKEIMFVPGSYTFHGERTIAAKDHSADGWTIKKGTVDNVVQRRTAGIVDRPGQRPTSN
ncbi:hypothetical protein BZB76_0519 [Actinomadura pelletieri DSM 43383]|uniref:CU044_5270 family protein n=1 Tax=Actinomadura pelletieri DSM 43383 TaxID=1120940 RepID=A0A495QYE7_9ACTN|nr:CU044_5270 family protein [Actinomadura pelletieri]RKS79078.1 hypothetical protein BZB76_0519 [Actinomadura pelletieri DSM 43383]